MDDEDYGDACDTCGADAGKPCKSDCPSGWQPGAMPEGWTYVNNEWNKED